MIVYVESNFLIELALGQEEASYAGEILSLAEQGKIDLAFPSFALSEPFATVMHRARGRERLAAQLNQQLRELDRSAPHQPLAAALQHVPGVLLGIGRQEFDLLERTVARLLAAARRIETDGSSFQRALACQATYDLAPQDAIIYAAVLVDLDRQSADADKCFISRNWKDFGDPGIRAELQARNCRYEETFEGGLAFIRDVGLGM